VLDFAEAPLHAHAQARQAFVTLDGVVQPAPAPRFGRSQPATPKPAPTIGEHSAQVLAEVGYSEAEIAALKSAGVVAGALA
ncbi:MAG: CoA transferase, partial [Rubrivivax sp.]|nr:CoA transferase [Rubrivivax sp.]